jgi:hypothetical protein
MGVRPIEHTPLSDAKSVIGRALSRDAKNSFAKMFLHSSEIYGPMTRMRKFQSWSHTHNFVFEISHFFRNMPFVWKK